MSIVILIIIILKQKWIQHSLIIILNQKLILKLKVAVEFIKNI